MSKKLKYIKDKNLLNSALEKLSNFHKLVLDVQKEVGYSKDLDTAKCDLRDLMSMCYLLTIVYPNLSNDEYKLKFKTMYQDYMHLKDDNLSIDELDKAKLKTNIYLDNLIEFKKEYKNLMDLKTSDDYYKMLVYATLTQCFGTKREENIDYFNKNIKSVEDVKEADQIEKISTIYTFDLINELALSNIKIDSYTEVTMVGSTEDEEDLEELDRLNDQDDLDIKYAKQSALERKYLEISSLAANGEILHKDYVELNQDKYMYKIAKANPSNESIELSGKYACYIEDSNHLAKNLVYKIVGDDTNEKRFLKNAIKDYDFYSSIIYINGLPIDNYLPQNIKNLEGKTKEKLINRARGIILMKALTDPHKKIDIVRYNDFKNEVGYSIQRVKVKFNQEEYEKANYSWFRRHLFPFGIKNAQKIFDESFNNDLDLNNRHNLIKEDINLKINDLNSRLNKNYTVRETSKYIANVKEIEELKIDNNIKVNNIELDKKIENNKGLNK
jgi:hypothetical protein